ncbi:MAG: hypothetical protein JNG90_09220 [Planctomycetaceae bacterium]|nr:hypothetical protein [Planctomycetaceae bacterium]
MTAPVMLSGGGLWIEFTWQGDRWGHRIGVEADSDNHRAMARDASSSSSSGAGLSESGPVLSHSPGKDRVDAAAIDAARGHGARLQRTVVFESIEGTPEEDWPPSPPLQELHLEARPDGKQLALLVGMAGTSHWSLSVEFDPAAGTAVFDVACRVKRAPGGLGSRYRRSGSAPQEWSAEPQTSGSLELPRTARWRYGVAVGGSARDLKIYCQAV